MPIGTSPRPPLDRRGLPPPRISLEPQGDAPFWVFLLVSALVFAIGVGFGTWLRPKPLPEKIDEPLDYLEAILTEPPPLGLPDAGAPAVETPPEPPPPPPEPEPPPPPPETVPEFPEPKPAPATPKPATPKPQTTPRPAATPRPAGTPRPVAPKTAQGATGGESDNPNAKPGPRGVPGGVPGGRGGSAGDFIARPEMPADNMIITRKYYGRGSARITYSNGAITDVSIAQSSGFSYVDSRVVAWIRVHWKVRPGASGSKTLPYVSKPPR